MQHLLEELDCRPPATNAAIADCEKCLGMQLPTEYADFLRATNGADGFLGKVAYVMLWAVDELVPLNQEYEVKQYVPGLLLFGSDGAGEAFGFDTRVSPWQIVQVPFVGMEWAVARPLGTSFIEFLEQLYRLT